MEEFGVVGQGLILGKKHGHLVAGESRNSKRVTVLR